MRSVSALILVVLGIGLGLTPSTGRAGDFGALAFSSNASFGYSYNYDHPGGAINRARDGCRKHASDCVVVRVFANVCVSAVRNEVDEWYITWAEGQTRAAREQQAMTDCVRRGGRQCRQLVNFCTGNARDN